MTNAKNRQIIIEKLIDGPCELVYQAWVNPDHIGQWWGPRGFSTTTLEINLNVGGQWRYTMHGPDGTDYPNRIQFREMIPNQRIAYDHDNDNDDDDFAFYAEIDFTPQEDKTLVRLTLTCKTDDVYKQVLSYGAIEGGKQHIRRFEEHVLALKGFKITRDFDITPEDMYTMWTDITHLKQWMGPKGSSMAIISGSIQEGESFLYSMQTPDGHTLFGKITYLELASPYRIQYIQQFTNEHGEPTPPPFEDPWPISMKTTVAFEPHQGKTKLSLIWIPIDATEAEQDTFDTNKDNMKMGWTGSFDALEEYINRKEKV